MYMSSKYNHKTSYEPYTNIIQTSRYRYDLLGINAFHLPMVDTNF